MATPPTLEPFVRGRSDASSVWYLGCLFTFLATAQETGGAFAAIDVLMRRGLEPPPHLHTREEESYYVREGEMTFTVGERTLTARPGDFVLLPRGIAHGFTLHSETATMLMMLTPAGLEGYFRQMSEPAQSLTLPPPSSGPPDVARMVALLSDYGVEFLPPS